jgi:hypothetical protein
MFLLLFESVTGFVSVEDLSPLADPCLFTSRSRKCTSEAKYPSRNAELQRFQTNILQKSKAFVDNIAAEKEGKTRFDDRY